MSWVWLMAAIASEIAATLSLRASDGLRRRSWLVPVILGYAAAFGFLALTLEAGMKLGVAYGIWSALGIALVAILARLIWREPLTNRMIVGIVVIAAGVALVEVG
ncbi:MAG TPA: multidrug efflux SMR transporter [Acidimicrobiia bacterium]|nr:multidrug efflux SMR transporter [Acidimicrobiia bacterium]